MTGAQQSPRVISTRAGEFKVHTLWVQGTKDKPYTLVISAETDDPRLEFMPLAAPIGDSFRECAKVSSGFYVVETSATVGVTVYGSYLAYIAVRTSKDNVLYITATQDQIGTYGVLE